MRILLVEDDQILVELLTNTLSQQNYAIDVAMDGEQGWIYGSTYTYDLIILDWFLPTLDGIGLCQRFREHNYSTPIILLTSRGGSQNKIRGLDAGADDYICKPFDPEELAARIRALLRRLNCNFLPVLRWGDLSLNPCTSEVIYQKQSFSLTAKEYRLLELFLRHPQAVFSVEDIIDRLWSSTEYPAIATVRSHLRRLRQKLKQENFPDDLITTVRGQGYCLKTLPQGNDNDISQDKPKVSSIVPAISSKESNKRSQHLIALTSIWEKYQVKREQQLTTLKRAIGLLSTDSLEISDRLSAIIAAHSLAGNLGQFGLDSAASLAKEIEQLLQKHTTNDSTQLSLLTNNLEMLKGELATKQQIFSQISQKSAQDSPLLLIVGNDNQIIEQVISEASEQGIITELISTPESVRNWLAVKQTNNCPLPDAVLLQVSFSENNTDLRQEYLALIAEFKLLTPSVPVIVIADRDRFQDRLLITRHGGKFYLAQPVNPSQVVTVCQKAIQNYSQGKKIMIVDDDVELLKLFPNILKPWGFKLTTLHDPRQFWDVLQAVIPDLLVLDIEMPHFSGIELCKVLRTHSYWSKLPVLFLSIHDDQATSTEVFASGGNDLVNKPVTAQKLAYRILNRLNPIR